MNETMDSYAGHAAQVVDQLHVGTSRREVVRALRAAIRPEHRRSTDPKVRTARKLLYLAGLRRHTENGGVYDSIYGAGSTGLEAEITERLYGGAANRAAVEEYEAANPEG